MGRIQLRRTNQLRELGLPDHLARATAEKQPHNKGRISIRAKANGEAEILLYEYIGYDWWSDDGMTSKQFAEEIEALGEPTKLTVRINSPGGDVFDGIAMFNQLSNLTYPVVCVVEGIAASAASVVTMAGDTVEMFRQATLMIHDSWCSFAGNEQDMRDMADVLSKIDGQIASVYADRSGKTALSFRRLMDSDTYLTADEAIELGLCDAIAGTAKTKASRKYSAKRERVKTRLDAQAARLKL